MIVKFLPIQIGKPVHKVYGRFKKSKTNQILILITVLYNLICSTWAQIVHNILNQRKVQTKHSYNYDVPDCDVTLFIT